MRLSIHLACSLGLSLALCSCASPEDPSTERDAERDPARPDEADGGPMAPPLEGSVAPQLDGGADGAVSPRDGGGMTVVDSGERDASGASCAWQAFEDQVANYDPVASRLCREFRDPNVDERYFIDCRIEGARFGDPAPDPKDELLIMTWNMERNYRLDDQIRAVREGIIPAPDIILAGEVDRGCGRSAKVNGAHEFARALGYHYAFGVEFVELVGPETDAPCEHGQAIFSRYPLGNVNLFRHTPSGNDEYDRAEQPRVGTRADVEADVLVGDHCVRVSSVHYDDKLEEEPARTQQAIETAERGLGFPVRNYVIGGDMNTILYFQDPSPASLFDSAARALWERGYHDVHHGTPDRITVPFALGPITVPAVVDLLWVREPSQIRDPGHCSEADCGALSDHLPQWFTLELR
jgi:endonuclease/exonuclease/phosphatase family metal-dependent hydrolase